MTYRGRVQNGQITLNEPVRLPEGAEVNVQVLQSGARSSSTVTRRDLLDMPIEERRRILAEQAERAAPHYETVEDRSEWQGGDIVE